MSTYRAVPGGYDAGNAQTRSLKGTGAMQFENPKPRSTSGLPNRGMPVMTSPLTYDDIETLAAELGRPASTLIALAPSNDPSIAARPARLWRTGSRTRSGRLLDPEADSVHIRRLHYLVVNQPPDRRPAKLDGTPYENTFDDWRELCDASLAARELGLVDADRFVDRRAGEPTYIFIPDRRGVRGRRHCHRQHHRAAVPGVGAALYAEDLRLPAAAVLDRVLAGHR